MKAADVRIGGTYAAKVSERIVPVTVERSAGRSYYSDRPVWLARNVRTGREIRVSAARLRFELVKADCGHWLRAGRDLAAHRATFHRMEEEGGEA